VTYFEQMPEPSYDPLWQVAAWYCPGCNQSWAVKYCVICETDELEES
jgi:hypothetical protein